jgi:hypothetical protein
MKSQNVQAHAAWWLEHVERWRQSGMTKTGYCAANSLSLHSFRYFEIYNFKYVQQYSGWL